MKDNIKFFVGALIVLIAASFLFKGEITGNVIACSISPKVTTFKQVSDTVSINWEDTSTSTGKPKYQVFLFVRQEDGTYDFNNPLRSEYTDGNYVSFKNIKDGVTYVTKVRAINHRLCAEEHSGFAVSQELTTDLSNEGMPKI